MVMLHAALCRNQTVACDRAWDSELDASPEHPTYYGMLAASFMPKDSNVAQVSNVKLPLDNFGNQIYTGEASVLRTSNSFYFYFNDWAVRVSIVVRAPRVARVAASTIHLIRSIHVKILTV